MQTPMTPDAAVNCRGGGSGGGGRGYCASRILQK